MYSKMGDKYREKGEMMFPKIDDKIENIIKSIEVILAIILVLTVVAEGVYIVFDLLELIKTHNIVTQSQEVLDHFLILVVTLEFAIMLIRKNPFAVVDIFMIALARKVILEYDRPMDYLIAAIIFTILIIIRKTLIKKKNI